MQESCYLIVGLGNPGTAYVNTRHNLGFLVLEKFAEKHGLIFKREARFLGKIAQGQINGKKVILLLPLTYMNNSGESVRPCADFYRILSEAILAVCDDVAIEFGTLRLRPKGSAGGHKGLKSIETHLGTAEYPRLRVGVSDRLEGDLADYVLGSFTEDERKELPKILENAVAQIEQWLQL